MYRLMTWLLLSIFSFAAAQASQVVLITGASRGIGLATAELLSSEGYTVYAGVRKLPLATPAAYNVVELDVTDQRTVDAAVAAIVAKEGRIDALVNNAGIAYVGAGENLTIEEAQAIFDVNFFGVMRMQQAVLPVMRAQNHGRIVQISSRSGFRPHPYFGVYAASKFALEGLSETMAALLKPWNIAVSVVEPGPVSTEFDYISPYGSRLPREQDPFYAIFEKAGLLDPYSPAAQSANEIALIIKEAIEAETPLFRYQTSASIREQASLRLVDPTGLSGVEELQKVLFQ